MYEPTTFEIVLKGRASARLLRPLLDDFAFDLAGEGNTRLVGEVRDAAHLHGVVAHLTSVNVELISIVPAHRPVDEHSPIDAITTTTTTNDPTPKRSTHVMITVSALTKQLRQPHRRRRPQLRRRRRPRHRLRRPERRRQVAPRCG